MSKKHLRFLFLGLVLVLLTALISGCGAPDTAPPDEGDGDEMAGADLDFVVWSYGIETIQDNISNFEAANPGVTVTLQDHSWLEYHDIMVGRFVANDAPPLLYGSDHWLQEWASAGWLEPLDTHFPQVLDYNDELAPYALQGMTYDGHVYGLSYYADTIDFVYNADHLTEAGYDSPPETWQDVWDMSMKLKADGIVEYPMTLAFSQAEGASIEAFISMIYGRHDGSGALFDDSNNPTFNTMGSAAYEAIEWLREAYEAEILAPAALQTAEIDQVKSMQAGSHTFTIVPQYNMAELNRPDSGDFAGSFKIALMPGSSHSTVGYVRFYAMTPAAADMGADALAGAWAFLEYFGGKTDGEYTVVKRWAVENGLGFAQLPLFEDADVKDAFGKWGDVDDISQQASLARAKEGLTPRFGTWDVFTRAEVHKAILGEQDTMTSLQNMADKWAELASE
jgi:multiple sugar transport system substrate-binding protein